MLNNNLKAVMNKQIRNYSISVEKIVRTDESCFSNLLNFPYPASFIDDLPSFPGMRMAYIDAPATSTPNGKVALCLHGEPSWSYLYRKMIPKLQAAGYRVVAPDLFGFGRSDKPIDETWYQFETHRASLLEFIEHLDLNKILLVVQDWGGLLGLTLPHEASERYGQLLVMNTTLATGDVPLSQGFKDWRAFMASQQNFDCAKLFSRACPHLSKSETQAYSAPFSTVESLAGVRRFPALVPEYLDSPGASISRDARQFWRTQWRGQSFMAIGMADPVLGTSVMQALRTIIRDCPEPMMIENGGHFLQEWQSEHNPIVENAIESWS
jgi:pimeloyl-ACP methyl ester carboxylesterase